MRSMTRATVLGVAMLMISSGSSTANVIHPDIPLLDRDGNLVVSSGEPVSTMQTCGGCHDTDYISSHSYHASLGSDEVGKSRSGRSFDWSPGWIGRFDPLVYDRFDPRSSTAEEADPSARIDLGLADWIRNFGIRHVGGSFTTHTPEGIPLEKLGRAEVPGAWTYARGGPDGNLQPWDWKKSGVTEMNCFLCHLADPAANPSSDARGAELRKGNFSWAATATLANTGIVRQTDQGWRYDRAAFGDGGTVKAAQLGLRAPTNKNCGLCHGTVITGPDEPFFVAPSPLHPQTETTGEIIAGHRIRRSGMNVAGKDALSRPWDVHAERMVQCTDCHGSLNDPAFATRPDDQQPEHLVRSSGGLSIGQFLLTPSHDFGKGHSSQSTVARDLDGSVRECEECHRAGAVHDWLPYPDRHLVALRCESCHVPKIYAAAREQTDWTVLGPDRKPQVVYRGTDGDPADPTVLLDGFEPLLLPRNEVDGSVRWSPQNLMASWYWYDEQAGRPVRRAQLEAAYFSANGNYRQEILDAFDADGNGELSGSELRLDSDAKVAAVQRTLRDSGVPEAEVRGEIQPYGIHHDVAAGKWAIRECTDCHGAESRFSQDFEVAAYTPAGVLPQLVGDATVSLAGELIRSPDGRIVYRSNPEIAGFYLLGFERYSSVDVFGRWAVILVLLGVVFHGGIRIFLSMMPGAPNSDSPRERSES